jgi:hypothetical protein
MKIPRSCKAILSIAIALGGCGGAADGGSNVTDACAPAVFGEQDAGHESSLAQTDARDTSPAQPDASDASSAQIDAEADAVVVDVMNEAVGKDAVTEATESRLDATTEMDSESGTTSSDAGSCNDQMKNGDETDVDCGGPCPPCGPNKRCQLDSDCSGSASGCDADSGGCKCDAVSMRCVYDHCFDHKRDDGETDVDCGGGSCPVCLRGQGCQSNTDCWSSACDGISLVCVPNPCIDHRQDGNETDVDCGGANSCSRCRVGQKCNFNFDCQAGHVCSMEACQ